MAKNWVWVIGGTSGIGAATVDWLEAEGADVYNTGNVECDVRSVAELRHHRDFMERGDDGIAGLVYSAGVNYLQWLGKSPTIADLMEPISVNLNGFIKTMEVLTEGDRAETQPLSVVAVSSDAAVRPMRTSISYCASKAGLDMAVRVAARELGPHGWRVNAVSPGMTDNTGMQEYVDATVPDLRGWDVAHMLSYEKAQEVVPGRLSPEDVADLIGPVLLSGPHLNGSIVTLNGGR